jgi:hypothetical protein
LLQNKGRIVMVVEPWALHTANLDSGLSIQACRICAVMNQAPFMANGRISRINAWLDQKSDSPCTISWLLSFVSCEPAM